MRDENKNALYADFNGSAPLDNTVKEYLLDRLEHGTFSNPNSSHALGKKIMFDIEKSRRSLAKNLGAKAGQIIFNSGSSEGISHIFYSLLGHAPKKRKLIVTSGIEHSCIIECCQHYQNLGFEVITISTEQSGVINLKDLEDLINERHQEIALVTVMAANNETGVIQPLNNISNLCQKFDVPVFSDTTQYIGKTSFNFEESGLDFAVMSSHKIGGIIGCGAILAKDPTKLVPFIMGGGQERGYRGGTQNYIGIESMAVAMDSFIKNGHKLESVQIEREKFETEMKKLFPQIQIIGEDAPRLAATTMLSHPDFKGQEVQIRLEDKQIYVTTSSACSDGSGDISKVLKAMNTPVDIAQGVIRISFCCNARKEHYDRVKTALQEIYTQ